MTARKHMQEISRALDEPDPLYAPIFRIHGTDEEVELTPELWPCIGGDNVVFRPTLEAPDGRVFYPYDIEPLTPFAALLKAWAQENYARIDAECYWFGWQP